MDDETLAAESQFLYCNLLTTKISTWFCRKSRWAWGKETILWCIWSPYWSGNCCGNTSL